MIFVVIGIVLWVILGIAYSRYVIDPRWDLQIYFWEWPIVAAGIVFGIVMYGCYKVFKVIGGE